MGRASSSLATGKKAEAGNLRNEQRRGQNRVNYIPACVHAWEQSRLAHRCTHAGMLASGSSRCTHAGVRAIGNVTIHACMQVSNTEGLQRFFESERSRSVLSGDTLPSTWLIA